MDTEKLIFYGALAIGGYFLYKKIAGPGGVADKYVASPIANAYTALTLPGQVNVLGQVILPNGQRIPLNTINVDDSFTFQYLGGRYRLTGRDAAGNYSAVYG